MSLILMGEPSSNFSSFPLPWRTWRLASGKEEEEEEKKY
jgi:hypothetical protein